MQLFTTLFRTVLRTIALWAMVFGVLHTVHGQVPTCTTNPCTDTETVTINAEVIHSTVAVPDATNFSGVYENGVVTLTWETTFVPITGFELYYRANSTDPFSGPIALPSGDREYLFTNPDLGTTYEFELITVSGATQSPGVTTAVVIPAAPTPTPPPGGPTPGNPGGGTAILPPPVITSIFSDSDLTQITIAWEQTEGSTNPIEEYRIYRAIDGGSFSTTPYAVVSGDTFSFTDTAVNNNTTYRYFVTAKNTSQQASGNSNVVSLTLIPGPPESTVTSINPIHNSSVIPIPYIGYDAYGIAEVSLYYSYNGGPYILYETTPFLPPLPGTIEGFFTFDSGRAQGDGVYEFYTIASNNRGVTEPTPTQGQGRTTIATTAPTFPNAYVVDTSNELFFIATLYIGVPNDATEMYIGTSQDNVIQNQGVVREWIPISTSVPIYYDTPGEKSITLTYRNQYGLLSPSRTFRITFSEDGAEVIFTEEPEAPFDYFTDESGTPEETTYSIDETAIPEELRGTADITNAFFRDTDGDGVTDGDEETYYGTDPEEFTIFDFETFYFTTNINDDSTFYAGEAIVLFGLAPPGGEIDIFLINEETGEEIYIGTARVGNDGRYMYRLRIPDDEGTYTMVFHVKEDGLGSFRTFERGPLVVMKEIDTFFSHFFINLQYQFLYDLYTIEGFRTASLDQIRTWFLTYQGLQMPEPLDTKRPRVGIRHYIPDESILNIEDPITVHILWRHRERTDFWLAQRAQVLMIDEFMYFTPPRDLVAGPYELFVQAEDGNRLFSFPRMLYFTIAGDDFYSVATPPMKDLLQECAKMMHMIPNFWLWLIVAFLMGVLTSGLTHYIKEKRKENERYSNKEQEIPRI